MPTYEYHCASNGRTLEVSHKIAEQVRTWGELCRRAGIDPGRTARTAPVRKLISASAVHTGRGGAAGSPVCDTGACDMPSGCELGNACGGGVCGAH